MKNDDKKTINKFSKIIFYITLIVMAIIFAGYLIRNITNCEGDMFSYSGAVIGGGLTLVGVIITIMYQEKKSDEDKAEQEKLRKEELAIQYKPIIFLEQNKDQGISKDNNLIFVPVNVENHGRAEAINLSIKYTYKNMKFKETFNILAKNQTAWFYFSIPINFFKPNIFKFTDKEIEFNVAKQYLNVEYLDIFNNKYTDVILVDLSLKNDYTSISRFNLEKIE